MKNRDLFRFKAGLESVSKIKGVKFAYAVIKNKKAVVEELEILEKVVEVSDEYKEYEQQRVQLCEKHVDRDGDGNMITSDNTYVITCNKVIFEKEFDILKKSNINIITEREKQLFEYDKMLNENSTILEKLVKVSIDDVPTDISGDELENIFEMID